MFKKGIPLVLMSGLVLGACGMNNTVPKNNETPMQNVEDRTRDFAPKVRDDMRGGTNLDGIDNGRDVNGTGGTDGVINNDTTTTPNETIIDNANPNVPNETTIDNNLNKNGNNR